MPDLPGLLQQAIQKLDALISFAWPFGHANLVEKALLDDSLGLLLKVWFGLILRTTDFETGHDFTLNATIQAFEPKVQLIADAALTLIVVWAAYRIMWGHGLRSQYTARILLPRLFMATVLINFALPLMQAVIQASNTASDAVQAFGTIPVDWKAWLQSLQLDPSAGVLQIVTTGILIVGYDVLGIAYLIRYTILIVLAITAPLAGLLFTMPETHHLAKQWSSLFMTNLLMQPMQLFVLAIGFALENGQTPVRHLFALAALLVVFKVPGAMGGAEKTAHKLESAVKTGLHALEHAVAHA